MKASQPRIVLLMDTSRAYAQGLLRGVLKYSRLHGPFSFLRKHHVVSGGPKQLTLATIRKWEPDGILWREGNISQDIKSLGVPVIYAPFTKPNASMPNIVTDDKRIGATAAEYLLRRGFQSFAFYDVGGPHYWARGRRQSFVGGIEDAGYTVSVFDRTKRRTGLADWLASLPLPVGLMLCTDDGCQDCYEAASQAGLRIPEDMAVVGVGNDELVCDFVNPPLSSVGLNSEFAGYAAAQRLVEMIQGKRTGRNIVVGALDVVERQSTNVFAMDDALISRAVQYICEHVAENIHVDDVVRAVPLSRRALYKRFKEAVGRSIYDEIRRIRMDYAARMLVDTHLPIAEVAVNLGFEDAKNFARVFQREKGTTPFKYRTRHSPYR